MIKFEGGKVIEIDREAKEVAIPPTATRICEVACFFGSITSLDLENTQITIIEKHAFANCYKLKKVRFPSCLEEICEGAFKQCRSLKHILFPSNSKLVKIGNNAFVYCEELEKFDFSSCLEFIGEYIFDKCNFLQTIDLRGTKVRHIGYAAYSNKTILLPPTVVQEDIIKFSENCWCHIEIDKLHPVVQRDSCGYFFSNGTIFYGKKKSSHVLIRRGVERIAGNCFFESKLVSVTIPSSVTEISDFAFYGCRSLQHICFNKDSLLRMIGEGAFSWCLSIKKIHFPKSLKIIKERAFECCFSLERVVFPQDSQLERIEGAFKHTAIKRLSLPPSVREIIDVSYGMEELESMLVSNEYYQSNEEGSAIFSNDRSELVCVIKTLDHFEIPDSVRVIKKRAFYQSSIMGRLIIPPSVEVIEEESFKWCNHLEFISFKEGSRLKSLSFNAFKIIRDLIINNQNFVKMENDVVMSLNPMGIVFVPSVLAGLEIPPGVEVIYSHAFFGSKIKNLKFPKSLKKICSYAFYGSSIESITFEKGTELDFIGNHVFSLNVNILKLPLIKGDLAGDSLDFGGTIEFPPNLCQLNKKLVIPAKMIVCPRSSLSAVASLNLSNRHLKLCIQNK